MKPTKKEQKIIDKYLNILSNDNWYIAFELNTNNKISIPTKFKDKIIFSD